METKQSWLVSETCRRLQYRIILIHPTYQVRVDPIANWYSNDGKEILSCI